MSAQVKTSPADTPVSPSSDVLSGTGYRLLRSAGRGGMGHVYEAIQISLHRKVAIKLLDRRLAEDADPACAERMVQEARVLAQFDHEHIVKVLHLGSLPGSGDPYVVMELLQGETLHALLKRKKRLPVDEAVRLMVQLFAGLEAMHEVGFAHRDLKPRNIFLTTTGVVKLLDFGAVKSFRDDQGEDPFSVRPTVPALTKEGAVIGTLMYMAPEQLSGRNFDCRVDVYAAGILLYRMLSGTDPFGEEDHVSQAFAHLTKIPRPLGTVVQVPEGINRAVMRAIEKNPDNRFSTAQEFSDALTAVISGVHPVSEVTEKGTVRMDVRTLRQAVFPQPPSSSPGIPAPTSSSSGRLLASMPSPPPSGRRLPIPELLQSSSGWPAVDPSPVPPSVSTPHERGLFPTLDRKTVFWIILAVFFAFGVLTALFIVLRRV